MLHTLSSTECNPLLQVSRETYGVAPEVTCTGDLQSTIPYIPTHLDYMLYELLKNAMRYVLLGTGFTHVSRHTPALHEAGEDHVVCVQSASD